MTSLRQLVRSSLNLGASILNKTALPKVHCHPSVTCLHTLVSAPVNVSKPDDRLLSLVAPIQCDTFRWASIGSYKSQDPKARPELNHWSKQWMKDRKKKKRFSNEGKYYRSIFTRKTAEELWKSVTSQSSAALKSGSGKRGKVRRRMDLNRGQVMGDGPNPWVLPGFNAPVSERITPLPENKDYDSILTELRKRNAKPLRRRQHPLERGWTSAKFGGRKLGPPDPIGEQSFEEFETYVLDFKRVCHMDTPGRIYSYSCLVVTGNGKGLAGFAVGKSTSVLQAQRKARNKAILRLQYVDMHEGHTVCHKIYSKFHASHLFIEPRPEGHGVRCTPIHAHRVLSTVCKAIGMKDLSVVVEHSRENTFMIVRGFFAALRAQKTIQQLSDELRLHCVEYCAENDHWPNLIASPRPEIGPVRHDAEVGTQEYRDLDLVLYDGKTTEFPSVGKPPWTRDVHPVHGQNNFLQKNRWKIYHDRHQEEAELRRYILYSEDYPAKLAWTFKERELARQNEENLEDASLG